MRLPSTEEASQWRWTAVAMVFVMALLGYVARIGGDWDWLVALGDHVRATGSVPDGVPFAAADTAGWHNVPLLGELVASALHDLGERAPVVGHLVLVVVALAVLATTAGRRGAGDGYRAGTLLVLALASLPTLGIVRAQTFSLVPFALLVALVSSQALRPDRRIWWAVPLVAVWGNLHGAALLGVCVLGAYLLVHRIRTDPWQSVGVGVASLLALCATPVLWRTPAYYAEVFDNVSAQRAEGLWARPSLSMPFDVVMLLGGGVLLVLLLRSRRQPWEYVAVLGLCLATASASRHGIWLLFLLVVLAPRRRDEGVRQESVGALSAVTAGLALMISLPVMLVRGDAVLGASPVVVDRVSDLARDRVVLAPAPLSEALAVHGVLLWAGNPLDAFTHADQAAYLDFLDGTNGASAAISEADLVVVKDGSSQARLVADEASLEPTPCGEQWTCYVRR